MGNLTRLAQVFIIAMFTAIIPLYAASRCTLAKDGEARMPIVLAAGVTNGPIRIAAEELALYLEKISGAKFEITEGDVSKGIVIGTIEQFPGLADRKTEKALEIRNGFNGRESFIIRSERKRAILLGASPLGASHAVYTLLESLGCRWYFPSPAWEIVPKMETISVKLEIEERPAIPGRRIWYGYGFFERSAKRSVEDYDNWARRNRMAKSLQYSCGHAWQNIIRIYSKEFESHPEYLALVKTVNKETGQVEKEERKGDKLCVSNPAVVEICRRYALDYFKKNPDSEMVSMEVSDGGGQCECDACAKMGTVSDRVFYLANEVAKAVSEKYPGKWVGHLAYNMHSEPPSFELEPNLYVQLTAGFIRGRYTYEELLSLWPKKCKYLGFYEYFSVFQWDWDMLPGGRGSDIDYLQMQIRRLAKIGATSLDCESGNNWGPHGRGYYLANKLMWNPDADAGSILDDFYKKAFGPAAPAVERYYNRFNQSDNPLMSTHLLGLAFRDIQEASRLAADRPDVLTRLQHLKIYLRYVHLKWMMDRENIKDKKKTLAEQILTHVYRNRYTYMNHWEAVRQHWSAQLSKEYDEPSWATDKAPWIGSEPDTAENIETAFAEGLEYFVPQDIEEIEFSRDLVPVEFPSAPEGHERDRGAYQGGFPIALYSFKGEPLNLTVVAGTIAWYRDRAPARYELVRAGSDDILKEDKIPLDGEEHLLKFDVPGPGLYFFRINESSAGWSFRADKGRVLTIPIERGKQLRHGGWNHELYFYVPSGTRKITYFWDGNTPHRVNGADGKVVKEVLESGTFITVDVPGGQDGKIWFFDHMAIGRLWFFNVPNNLAVSPSALMVPKETAQKDGLIVREQQ